MEGALNIFQRQFPLAVSRCLWDRDVFSSIFHPNLSPLHFWSSYYRDKDDFIHIYNRILLSHKKEWNWVTCREAVIPRVCHTEWRSRKEKNKYCIKYMNAYIRNLWKRFSWTYLQGRDVEVRNRYVDTGGAGVRGWIEEQDWNIHTTMCQMDTSGSCPKLGALSGPRRVGLRGWGGGSPGGRNVYPYSWLTWLYSRN